MKNKTDSILVRTLTILLAAVALLALPINTHAQSLASAPTPAFGYQPQIISLPFATLAGSTATNLANGWTNSTIYTNSVTLWNTSSNAFVTTTTYVTNNTVQYATMDARAQRYLPLQFEFNGSGASTANYGIMLSRSVTGINYDTANNLYFTFPLAGTAKQVGITNIDMMGFGFARIQYMTNADASVTLTNLGAYTAIDPRNGK